MPLVPNSPFPDSPPVGFFRSLATHFHRLIWTATCLGGTALLAAESGPVAKFHQQIEPLLVKYCYDCHGDGVSKGQVAFDEFESPAALLARRELWRNALRNVRAGLMPPDDGGLHPEPEEIERLTNWIKHDVFRIDPANPDPGRVTARRLNRVEYRNTIRDLMGIDFNSEVEFPPDDSGNGFDNNGDVLTLSPLLLEKYLAAAETIVDRAVPKVARVVRESVATGRDFRGEGGQGNGERLNARQPARVSRTFTVEQSDRYRLVIEWEVRGSFDFDPSRCRLICRVDGEERLVEDIVWHEGKSLRHEYDLTWAPGPHTVAFEVEPLPPVDRPAPRVPPANSAAASPANGPRMALPNETPNAKGAAPAAAAVPAPSKTRVEVRIVSVQVRGPLSPKFWVATKNHGRFFPDGPAPEEPGARDRYAAKVLRRFATQAFRRPVAEAKVQQLVEIARSVYAPGDKTFEEGVGRAMMAVLASSRFLFRLDEPHPADTEKAFARIDDYTLASRLSYFLWSTMPDADLFRLAERGELRDALPAQVTRMLRDTKAQAFVRSFTGQWLQARDVEFVPINARVVLGPNAPKNREGRIEFDGEMRKLMRSETEMVFDHVIRGDRSVLELIESDYTFLNSRLAAHYGVPGVEGDQLRLVQLPPDSPRGGVLTQGTVLAVTSNPTRTSPVKRGLFILDNILGTPPPPPPPDIPALEEAKDKIAGHEPRLSEMLALHRADKRCNSCHARMDPLGLAFENFNALGGWRDREAQQPIDASGQLVTGETFANVRELKHVLAHDRRTDFYRCLTEKFLTYALGRGLEDYDTHTVDQIAERLERTGGRMSTLLMGVIESVPFQKQRTQKYLAHAISPAMPSSTVVQTEPQP